MNHLARRQVRFLPKAKQQIVSAPYRNPADRPAEPINTSKPKDDNCRKKSQA
jgi:hypothetical protein